MFLNHNIKAEPKPKGDVLKDLPKNIFFTQIFPHEKYPNGALLENITEYISQKHKVFGLRDIPDNKYCDYLLSTVNKGSSEIPSFNGFVSSFAKLQHQYSKKEILAGVYDLVKQEKIIAYPLLFNSFENQKQELCSDLIFLANMQNSREYLLPFIKTAVGRNLQTLVGWLRKEDISKLWRGDSFGEDIFSDINQQLKRLMYVTLLNLDNEINLKGLEKGISDYGTVEMMVKYLSKHELLAKEPIIYLCENKAAKARIDWRILNDSEKYTLVKKEYFYFQGAADSAKYLAKEYGKIFDLLQHDLISRVSNELVLNQETNNLLKEFNDFRRDEKLKFPNIRYSELLISLINKHLSRYKDNYTFDQKTPNLYLERGDANDRLFCLYEIFVRLHKKALAMDSFRFFDLNAESLLIQVKKNIIDRLWGNIYEELQVKELIKNKEPRLKTEFTEMYNQNVVEVVPFDYSNYMHDPSAKMNLINANQLKPIVKYQKYYEKKNYFLLPMSIFIADKNTQTKDPWQIDKMLKVYNYTVENDNSRVKLKTIEDLTLRLINPIFSKLNELDFREDKHLFDAKAQAILQELRVSLAIYNKNPEYKNSKLLRKVQEIIERKLANMLTHNNELAKKRALLNFDPIKGWFGVLMGISISIGLFLLIGGVLGLVISLVSSVTLGLALYHFFGRLLKRKITPIEPSVVKSLADNSNKRVVSRHNIVVPNNQRKKTVTKEKEPPKKMTKSEQDEIWAYFSKNINKRD